MAARHTEAIMRDMYEAFSKGDMELLQKLCEPGGQLTIVPFGTTVDLMADFQAWASAFGERAIEILNLVCTDDQAFAELLARGRHTGAFETPWGTLAATDREIELRACEVYVVRDARIVEGRMYFDAATLLDLLGHPLQLLAQPLGTRPAEAPRPGAPH